MKRVVLFIVSAAVLTASAASMVTPALAAPTPRSQTAELDLAAAVEAAFAILPELRLARLQVLEAELALLEAELNRSGAPVSYLEAQEALEEAQSALRAAALSAALRVEEAFYGALRAAELLELRRKAAEQAQARAGAARARFEAGMLPLLELQEIELASATAQAQLEDAERAYKAALLALSELTGLAPLPPLKRPDAAFAPLEIPLEEAIERARRVHPDVAAARRALRAAERRLESAKLSDAPSAAVRRAEIAVERARIGLEQAEARAASEVRQAYASLEAAAQEAALKEKALSLALSRLDVARIRYDAGAISLLEFAAAEQKAMEARLDAASALWDYNLSKARILRLLGEPAPGFPALPKP